MSLYRRPNSPYWWTKLNYKGTVHYESTRERTKVEALKKEREIAARLEQEVEQQRKLGDGRYSLATLAVKFLAQKQTDGRAHGSLYMFEKHLQHSILPFFGAETDVRLITRERLEQFKAARTQHVRPVTICKELSTLRQMLKYASDTLRVLEDVPIVRNPKVTYEPKWRILSREELERLMCKLAELEEGNTHWRSGEALPFFLLAANTGMRCGPDGEVPQLRWEWIDWSRRLLRLPAHATKTRRARTIDLNDGALAALTMVGGPRREGKVFTHKKHYVTWHKALRSLDIENRAQHLPLFGRVRPHDLRHTFSSLAYAANVPRPAIRETLGHTTMFMEAHYAHAYASDRRQAAEAVNVLPAPLGVPLLPAPASVPRNVTENSQMIPETVGIIRNDDNEHSQVDE